MKPFVFSRLFVVLVLAKGRNTLSFTGLWCNGSTAVFGAVSRGSSPLSPTIINHLKQQLL